MESCPINISYRNQLYKEVRVIYLKLFGKLKLWIGIEEYCDKKFKADYLTLQVLFLDMFK
jgi:hypothetical protein